MKLKALLAGLALLWALPAVADNFVYSDAAGNFIVLPCTTANGVCTPTVSISGPSAGTAVDLVKVGGVAVSLGQKAMTASIPVVVSSDQSALSVAGTGTAGTANAGVVTVQGIASMTPILTNPGTAANWGVAATAAAVPANAVLLGTRADGGLAAGTAALTAPISCTDTAVISTASSGNVQLVALTTSETVYVCGWSVVATGTVAVQLIYGTGSACATGETDLTGAYPLVANGGLVDRGDFAVMRAAASNALCIELSGAVQVDGVLYYTKY
jgi:hypothetical protein